MPLPPDLVHSVLHCPSPMFDRTPIQVGMMGDPWRVAVASVLMCRARRPQVQPVLERLLTAYPTRQRMAVAEDLEEMLRPCGLHRNRARALQRLSFRWDLGTWKDLRELPGVGTYVADAVGLFCFGCKDIESGDHALLAYADQLLTKCAECNKEAVTDCEGVPCCSGLNCEYRIRAVLDSLGAV